MSFNGEMNFIPEFGKVLQYHEASVVESGSLHPDHLRDRVSQFRGGDAWTVGGAREAVRSVEGGDFGGGKARRGIVGGHP